MKWPPYTTVNVKKNSRKRKCSRFLLAIRPKQFHWEKEFFKFD